MHAIVLLRSTALIVLAVGALASAACGVRSVNEILVDPSRYRDREVRVAGLVVESYSVADRGAYRIGDESGELWVVSDRGVPRKDARVIVKGTIREGFNLGSLGNLINLPAGLGTGLVLMESSRQAQ